MKLAITFGLEHEKAHGASPGIGKTATLESGDIACLTRQASVLFAIGVQEESGAQALWPIFPDCRFERV
jgi:hypothetical protein